MNIWCPKNFENTFWNRPVMLRQSLDHSLNIPTINLGLHVTMPAFRDKLRQLAFPAVPDDLNVAATVGGLPGGTSPLIMSSAYGTFVNGGVWVEPHFIKQILDTQGRGLFEANPVRRRAWSETTRNALTRAWNVASWSAKARNAARRAPSAREAPMSS